MTKKLLKSLALILLIFQIASCTSSSSGDEQQVTDLEAVEELNASVEAVDGGTEAVENTVEPVSPITESNDVAEANSEAVTLPSDPLADVDSSSNNVENIDGVASANEKPAIAEPAPANNSNVSELPNVSESATNSDSQLSSSDPSMSNSSISSNASSASADTQSLQSKEEVLDVKPKKKKNRSEANLDNSSIKEAGVNAAQSTVLPEIQKIQLVPWRDGDTLVNAVYFARPGDTFKSISKKLYGDSKKQSLLKKVNPGIESVKAGDAIYYNSVNRPDDETKVLTFAEDNGVASETFVAQGGENIKALSKKLLGYSSAWKEVLATNPQMSANDGIAPGMEIKFWNSSSVTVVSAPKQNVATVPQVDSTAALSNEAAQNSQPTTSVDANSNLAANELPPPPTTISDSASSAPIESGNIPAPPVETVGANGENQEIPPPPPAVVPQEPPVAAAKAVESTEQPVNSDDSILNEEAMTLLLGAGIIAAAGVALVIIRKKRKNKELEEMLQNTQVG